MSFHRPLTLLLALPAVALVACAPSDDASDDTDATDTDTEDTDTEDTDTEDTDTEDTDVPDVDPCTIEGVTCEGPLATLAGTITESFTMTPDKQWVLSGGVFFGEDDGSTSPVLTIRPGTVIYGTEGSWLTISRGAKIEAVGTATQPIVFTSEATALEEVRVPGGWGGVVINGRAPHNKCAAGSPGCTAEGEAGTGTFGGNVPADDSGTLKYVRIEFGGFEVIEDQELNGLTLSGVGSGTEIDYLQVHGNADDGVEFFGGTVNVKHVVVSCVDDDGIDWDLGYTGKIQHGLVVQCDVAFSGESSNPNGIEGDNDEENFAATPRSAPVLSNLTFIGFNGGAVDKYGFVLRRGTAGELHNVVSIGWKTACLDVRNAESTPAIRNSIFGCAATYPATQDFEAAVWEADGAGNEGSSSSTFPGLTQTSVTLGGNPDFRPSSASSKAATGGVVPSDSFFDAATHRGGFAQGAADWTDGWTSFAGE